MARGADAPEHEAFDGDHVAEYALDTSVSLLRCTTSPLIAVD
jgi:hypothetical protein